MISSLAWILVGLLLIFPNNGVRASSSPVIGILTQPTLNQTNYIAASYVKWLEAGGARSIPILYDETNTTKLDDLFNQIDGLLLPGGASELSISVMHMLGRASETQFFPVWGTCMGFEFLIQYVGGIDALQNGFDAENVSLPLENVVPRALYRDPHIQELVKQDITMNNHHEGITLEHFEKNPRLTRMWDVTSLNRDRNGRVFVSTIEPRDGMPSFFGVQFHPEKNAFEYGTYPHTTIPYEAIDHSDAGVEFSLYLARFFVDMVRRIGESKYSKPDEYPLVNSYPMQMGYKFEQIYLLPPANGHEKYSHSSLRQRTPSRPSIIEFNNF